MRKLLGNSSYKNQLTICITLGAYAPKTRTPN